MVYKPVGVDENSDFPPRVESKILSKIDASVDTKVHQSNVSRNSDIPYALSLKDSSDSVIHLFKSDGSLAEAPMKNLADRGLPETLEGYYALGIKSGEGYINLFDLDGSLSDDAISAYRRKIGVTQATTNDGRSFHPQQSLLAIGTSLTRLGGAPQSVKYTVIYAASRELSWTSYNLGWNGRNSFLIAGKHGALPVPVSKPVTIPATAGTPVVIDFAWEIEDSGTTLAVPWTISGVDGLLTRISTTQGSFKRNVSGSSVSVPVGGQAIFRGYPSEYKNRVLVLECSRNNSIDEDPSVVITHQKAIVRKTTESVVVPQVLIMGEPFAQDEPQAERIKRQARIDRIKAAWPAEYVPAFEYLRSPECEAYLLSLKTSPPSWLEQTERDALNAWGGFTTNDQIDISNNTTPRSLRMDVLHPNYLGNLAMGHRLVLAIRERGWAL